MVASTFVSILRNSILADLVTTIGVYTIGKYEKWGNHNVVYFMSFSAGVLISVSFTHIVPKAFNMGVTALIYLLVGFMGLYVVNRFSNKMVCQDSKCADISIGIIPMLGIGLHSCIDGVINAVTFNVSPCTGVLAVIDRVLYEFPEGVVTFFLLERAGITRVKLAYTPFWRSPFLHCLDRWYPSHSFARMIALILAFLWRFLLVP